MKDIRQEIERVNEIVTLPTILTEIMKELGKEEVVTNKITRMVETDAALTSSILRVANSAFYGLRQKVESVGNAITFLGHTEISRILITFFMKQQLRKLDPRQESALERLWKHSINTSAIASLVCKEYSIALGGEEYTAGLLHDMGKIIIIQQFVAEGEVIFKSLKESGRTDIDVEREVIGISHDEIGGLLGERWNLPAALVEVMRFHHSTNSALQFADLAAVVRFADLLAESWGYGVGEGKDLSRGSTDESFVYLCSQYPRMKSQTLEGVMERLSEKHVEQKSLVGLF